jgi:hypothetical protein
VPQDPVGVAEPCQRLAHADHAGERHSAVITSSATASMRGTVDREHDDAGRQQREKEARSVLILAG